MKERFPAKAVMLASDIQSPIITSTGSMGWLAANVAKAWRRSEAEPEAPGEISEDWKERGGGRGRELPAMRMARFGLRDMIIVVLDRLCRWLALLTLMKRVDCE